MVKVIGDWQPTSRIARPFFLFERPTERPGAEVHHGHLVADTQAGSNASVPFNVVVPHIVEEPPAPADELHESPAGVVIALVHLQVLGQVRDPLRQQGDLNLGRAGVGLVEAMIGDGGLFVGHMCGDLGS